MRTEFSPVLFASKKHPNRRPAEPDTAPQTKAHSHFSAEQVEDRGTQYVDMTLLNQVFPKIDVLPEEVHGFSFTDESGQYVGRVVSHPHTKQLRDSRGKLFKVDAHSQLSIYDNRTGRTYNIPRVNSPGRLNVFPNEKITPQRVEEANGLMRMFLRSYQAGTVKPYPPVGENAAEPAKAT